MASININREPAPETYSVHPRKFIVWLFIISITMLFAAFTSAYLVRQAQGDWMAFELPSLFTVSTVLIVLSSVTMQTARILTKRDNINGIKISMFMTMLLGIAFIFTQWQSWTELVDQRVYFTGNPSGTFLYVLTGMHIFHLITGIIFVLLVTIAAFRYQVHSRNSVRISMCNTYWHFLTGLWIYLYIFLLLKH